MGQLLMGVSFGALGLIFATPLAITAIILVQALYVQDVLGEPIALLGANTDARDDEEAPIRPWTAEDGTS